MIITRNQKRKFPNINTIIFNKFLLLYMLFYSLFINIIILKVKYIKKKDCYIFMHAYIYANRDKLVLI